MLPFFRRIRQRLLTDNKFSKYLLYAVGEILLVVIGILIALQVNNWNTAKDQERQRQNFLTDLGEEIRKTHLHRNPFEAYQKHYQEADSILKLIQENRLSETEYRENKNLLLPMFSPLHNVYVRDNGNNLNLENGNNILKMRSEFPEEYQQLLYQLSRYKYWLEQLRTQTEKTFEEQNSIKNFMLNEHEWFYPSDSIDIRKAIDYSISNKNYKSRIELYRRNFIFIQGAITALRNTQVIIMAEIERLSGGSTADIKRVIEEFDFLPMETVSCDDNSTEIKLAEFQFNIIYNSTKQTLKVHRLNSSYEPYESFDIAPNEVKGFSQNVGGLFQVDMNGACYRRFKVIPNGYLLME
jgi:hypothetical protein